MSTLYPYQRQGVDRLVEMRRAILADEMGLGKSVQALTAVDELGGYPCLIVPPAGLKINWQREAKKHLGLDALVLSGLKAQAWPRRLPELTVANYDLISRRLEELLERGFVTLIADEAHYLCNRLSGRTKAVKRIARTVENCFLLSGTPVTNRPADLWSLLNLVRPTLFPSFHGFACEFSRARKRPWGWVYEGSKNLSRLHELLAEQVMVRRRKEDVLSDLPAKRRIVVPLELSDRRQYEAARGDFLGWVKKNDPAHLSGAERARGLGLANRLKQLVGRLKQKSVLAWVNDFLASSDGKLILFAHHRELIEGLQSAVPDAVKVYGGMTSSARQRALDAFENDSWVRLLVGQIESAGQGWSCKATSECAFAELDWRATLIEQAADRTHGVNRGAGGDSTAYFLLADGTIEEELMRAVDRKQRVARAVVDGGEGETLELFGEFCKALRAKG